MTTVTEGNSIDDSTIPSSVTAIFDSTRKLARRLVKASKALKHTDWAFDRSARFRRAEIVLKEIFYTLFVPRSVNWVSSTCTTSTSPAIAPS